MRSNPIQANFLKLILKIVEGYMGQFDSLYPTCNLSKMLIKTNVVAKQKEH